MSHKTVMSESIDLEPEKSAALARLRAFLDEIDEKTRKPGEKPLRQAVAEQARQRLDEMGADHV